MSEVIFKKLTLQGFGRYKDKVTVEFTEGINILAAPNESGKSTLMAGLTAVIFGLPVSSDPTAFGTSKYRNWDGAPVFSGEALFIYEQSLHQIARDFDSQRITVRRMNDERWTELVRGVHNPRANRPNERYLEFLDRVFGLRSAEMFMQTYFVGQPLPAATALSTEIQQLLSGGGSHYSKVLDDLMASIKQITRYGNRYYASLNNGRKNQRLEELQAEMERLEQAIAEQCETTDGLEQVHEELLRCEQQRLSRLEMFRKKDAAVRGFEQWLALRDRLRAARSKLGNLQSATERAEALERQLYSTAEQTEDGLSHTLTTEISQLDERLARMSGFAALGAEPEETIENCREWLSQKVQLYRRHCELWSELDELEQSLQREYAAFEAADLGLLQRLPAYLLERPRLVAEAEMANSALLQAEQAVAATLALRTELTAQLGDPELVSDTDITELQLLCTGRKTSRQEQISRVSWWVPAFGVAVSAAIYLLWGRSAGTAGTVASLLPMLLFILVPLLRKPTSQAVEMTAPSGKYTRLSQLPTEQLATLLTKLQQYRLHAQQQAVMLRVAQAKQQEANQKLQDSDAEFAGLVRQHPKLEQAFAGWRQLRSRLRDLSTQRQQLEGMLAYSASGACGFEGSPSRLPAVLVLTGHGSLQGERLLAALEQKLVPWPELLLQTSEYVELVKQRAGLVSQLNAYRDQQSNSAHQVRAALEAIYETSSCQSVEALQERLQDAQEEVLLCRKEWKELLLDHPDLPEISEMEDGQLVASRRRELSEEVNMLGAEIDQLDQRIFALKSKQGQLQGRQSTNLAQAMEQLAELSGEEQRLLDEATAIGIAATELSAAVGEFQGTYRNRLATRISYYFQDFTGDETRNVEVDDVFTLEVRNGDGQLVSPVQLSQGAQDQLYLAVRMAIADLTVESAEPPLILDDPLLTSDQERLARMRSSLEMLGRQVILLSHQTEYEAWGTTVKVV